MLSLFLVVLFVLFLLLLLFLGVFFSRNRNMISIGTVEFRCYVAFIIPVNLGKSLAIRD